MAQLQAPYGIYAVGGSVEPTPESMAWLVEGTDIVWLEQEAVTVDVRGQSVTQPSSYPFHRCFLLATHKSAPAHRQRCARLWRAL